MFRFKTPSLYINSINGRCDPYLLKKDKLNFDYLRRLKLAIKS